MQDAAGCRMQDGQQQYCTELVDRARPGQPTSFFKYRKLVRFET